MQTWIHGATRRSRTEIGPVFRMPALSRRAWIRLQSAADAHSMHTMQSADDGPVSGRRPTLVERYPCRADGERNGRHHSVVECNVEHCLAGRTAASDPT